MGEFQSPRDRLGTAPELRPVVNGSDHGVLVGVTARRLADGRVTGWHADGVGERSSYLSRVRAAGALPVVLDPATTGDAIPALLEHLGAIVLTGGPDVAPQRYGASAHDAVYGTDDVVDAFELALARCALD